jgi:hypothetical protein
VKHFSKMPQYQILHNSDQSSEMLLGGGGGGGEKSDLIFKNLNKKWTI